MLTSALRVPEAAGVKVTLILQVSPGGTDVPQLSFSEKSALFAPVTLIDVMVRVILPVFLKVETCGGLVLPTVSLPKSKLGGDSATTAPLTTCFSAGEVLDAKFASPLYTAVTLCVPIASAEIINTATPLLLTFELPRFVFPSKKLTVPVGWILKPCDVTVAVKVTDCPKLDGLGEEASAVVVGPTLVLISTPTVPLPQFPFAHSFVTSKSGFPSSFTSATATELAEPPGL